MLSVERVRSGVERREMEAGFDAQINWRTQEMCSLEGHLKKRLPKCSKSAISIFRALRLACGLRGRAERATRFASRARRTGDANVLDQRVHPHPSDLVRNRGFRESQCSAFAKQRKYCTGRGELRRRCVKVRRNEAETEASSPLTTPTATRQLSLVDIPLVTITQLSQVTRSDLPALPPPRSILTPRSLGVNCRRAVVGSSLTRLSFFAHHKAMSTPRTAEANARLRSLAVKVSDDRRNIVRAETGEPFFWL